MTGENNPSAGAAGLSVEESPPKRLLVPLDLEEPNPPALAKAEAIARRNGSEVTLVHVLEPFIQGVQGIDGIVPTVEEVNFQLLEQAKQRLERIRAEVAAKGVNCHAIVEMGKPWHIIVEVARKIAADLVVISTHGRKGLQHVLMGSTAERVVQHASCSVLVVRDSRKQ